MPLPKPRDLKLRDVTHSTINVSWEPAPGKVRKYIVRYKTPEEDVKQVGWRVESFVFLAGLTKEPKQYS